MKQSTILTYGVVLAVTALTSVPVTAVPVSGTCSASKVSFTTSTRANSFTGSTIFANIPQTAVSFSISGTSNTCLVVEFAAVAEAELNEALFVRAVLDGAVIGQPGQIRFSDGPTDGRAHTFLFAFVDVAPGPHTIRMQFKSEQEFENVAVQKHTTVVHHR